MTKTKTNDVTTVTPTVDTTGFQAFVALDKRYEAARQTAAQLGADVRKSADSLMLLTVAPYAKMDAKRVISHFGLDISEETARKYVLAAKVMGRLVRDDSATCGKVYATVGAAVRCKGSKNKDGSIKTPGYGLDNAEARLLTMPAGSTWTDWCDAVKHDIARLRQFGLDNSVKNIKEHQDELLDSQVQAVAAVLLSLGWSLTPPSK